MPYSGPYSTTYSPHPNLRKQKINAERKLTEAHEELAKAQDNYDELSIKLTEARKSSVKTLVELASLKKMYRVELASLKKMYRAGLLLSFKILKYKNSAYIEPSVIQMTNQNKINTIEKAINKINSMKSRNDYGNVERQLKFSRKTLKRTGLNTTQNLRKPSYLLSSFWQNKRT